MWSSRLFWKLYLTAAGLNLIAAVGFALIVSQWLERRVLDQVDGRLKDAAALLLDDLAKTLPDGPSDPVQARVRRLGQQVDIRITLVAKDGTVLADSEKADLAAVAGMDNHKNRPELLQAALSGTGASERVSPTLGVPMRYFAVRADGAGGDYFGLVRTATSVAAVRAQVARVQQIIWGITAAVSLVVLALAYIVVARITKPVAKLTAAAEASTRGDYDHRVHISDRDELGLLADAFNRMNQEMSRRLHDTQASSGRLATVLGSMADGVIAVDHQKRVLFANRAAGRLLEFNPEDASQRLLLEMIRNHAIDEAVTDSLAGREPRQTELRIGQKQARVLGISCARLPGEPSPGVVVVLHDLTDLRRLESLRHEFVANVSHELKTPLSSIKAYAETLRGGAIYDAANNMKFVQRIEEQADRLHQLILDVLSLARIESGQQVFEIAVIEIAPIAAECRTDHQATADAKQIALSLDAPDEPLRVRADAEGVRQILDNLIDNALKYTPEGGQVRIAWRGQDGKCVLEVEDSGIGIAPEDQARLFERFFRADKARSRELGGTGLGLSIVKHLAQSFGGSVRVESELGKGSKFSVELPLAAEKPAAIA